VRDRGKTFVYWTGPFEYYVVLLLLNRNMSKLVQALQKHYKMFFLFSLSFEIIILVPKLYKIKMIKNTIFFTFSVVSIVFFNIFRNDKTLQQRYKSWFG